MARFPCTGPLRSPWWRRSRWPWVLAVGRGRRREPPAPPNTSIRPCFWGVGQIESGVFPQVRGGFRVSAGGRCPAGVRSGGWRQEGGCAPRRRRGAHPPWGGGGSSGRSALTVLPRGGGARSLRRVPPPCGMVRSGGRPEGPPPPRLSPGPVKPSAEHGAPSPSGSSRAPRRAPGGHQPPAGQPNTAGHHVPGRWSDRRGRLRAVGWPYRCGFVRSWWWSGPGGAAAPLGVVFRLALCVWCGGPGCWSGWPVCGRWWCGGLPSGWSGAEAGGARFGHEARGGHGARRVRFGRLRPGRARR